MLVKNPVGILSRGVFFCLLVFLYPFAQAQPPALFPTRDQNPFVLAHGLPTPVSARLPAPCELKTVTSFNVSNTINLYQTPNEQFFVDTEIYQLNVQLDYALNKSWLIGLRTPFTGYTSGVFDRSIDYYHQTLGLPQNVRPLFPANQFAMNYQRNGITEFNRDSRSYGLGDINLVTAWQAYREADTAMSYWLSISLPTGNSNKLTGDGSSNLSLWLAADTRTADNFWFMANLGFMAMDNPDILKSINNTTVWFGNAGLQFQAWESILLKLQLDYHSALYNSAIDFLGSALQLSFGGSVVMNKQTSLDIAITEDIQTLASPDVTLNVSLVKSF